VDVQAWRDGLNRGSGGERALALKVFIAGATGVLGRGLIQQLRERGHEAVGLARSARGEEVVRSLGGAPRRADLFDPDPLARAADGADVVIHAATSIPVKTRIRPADWAANDRIRREGTRALAQAATQVGAKVYLQQSIAWLARPADGSAFDENSTPRPDSVTQSALDGEQIAAEAGARSGMAVGVLRCGWFYGPDSPHTRILGEGLRKRKIPIIGDGEAIWACLHTDDAAGAFIAVAEAGKPGLWHVVDDLPVTARDVLTGFARRLGAPTPRHVPAWLARLVAGRYSVEFITSSTRTSNARIRREIGWSPRFPSFEAGLDQVVAAWRAERQQER
jgi:nucleoside-diphosphate-sugar epimerase